MKTIHSGFDTIQFAIKGALSPASLAHLERAKVKAKETDTEHLTKVGTSARPLHVRSHGQQGGYAYVVSTGWLGEQISFKNSLDRTSWNGFVKLYSITLAALGWRKAVKQAIRALIDIGFHTVEISLNRVDYCIDILNAPLTLDPKHFIAHARTTKTAYSERCTHVTRGDTCETVMIGKSPGRQVVIYDKRAEIISKKKLYWFEIWGIDPRDTSLTIHRVEIRAGKKELKKFSITTWEDFETKIGDVINLAIARVLHVMRKQKALEYQSQIIGLMAGLAVCEGIELEHVAEHLPYLIQEAMLDMGYAENTPIRRAYVRARERLVFVNAREAPRAE